ncbi:MAG TPA: metallophosphoesterase family protein [Candidatus Dormibacteraeota bacterium]
MGTGAQTENGGFSRRRFLQGAGGAMLVAPALWIKPGFASELPAQVHLEFGSEPSRQMVVSWSTSAAVSRPRVKLGTAHGGFGRVIPAETRTYVDGLSGTEVFTHHALIEGLHASSDYTYQVLHDGADSVDGHFRTAPRGRERFRFTSFGDQSIPDQLGNPPTQPWTRYSGLIVPEVEAEQPLLHLLNGDLCYANVAGREQLRVQTWRSFFNNNSRSARFRPWMPAAGNHENERLDGRPGRDPYKAYQTWFDLPPNGAEPEFAGLWYALTIGNVRFVFINNDDVCYQDGGNTYIRGYSGGRQKQWLERTLREARDAEETDWIVVCMHQVAMSTAIPFNGCDLGIREEWLPLFDRYGVDLVVSGHEHHYERTLPVRGHEDQFLRPKAASHELDQIDTGRGTVHMILGGGGHNASSFDKYALSGGVFQAEIIAPQDPAAPTTPGKPIPLITPKPRELATWSATSLSPDPVHSHARDSFHGYGFGSFDVDPGVEGGWTTISVRYHRVLDPTNPADTGKARDYDSFTLRRRRSDGESEQEKQAERSALASG